MNHSLVAEWILPTKQPAELSWGILLWNIFFSQCVEVIYVQHLNKTFMKWMKSDGFENGPDDLGNSRL